MAAAYWLITSGGEVVDYERVVIRVSVGGEEESKLVFLFIVTDHQFGSLYP